MNTRDGFFGFFSRAVRVNACRTAFGCGSKLRAAGCLAVFLLTSAALHAATVGMPESWGSGNTAGWVKYDLINEAVDPSLSVENGALKVLFKKQSVKMPPEEYLVKADGSASGGRFAGDYISNGVLSLSFQLYCECPAEVCAVFYNQQTERLWRYTIPGVPTGQWVTVSVPVDTEALRNVNGVEGWSTFEQDLRNVSWAGVTVRRNSSMNAQAYRIDDFTLLGPGIDFAAWMSQFSDPPGVGTGNRNRLPGGDLDADGADNCSEWVAGTSAADPEDLFKVVLQPDGAASGIHLRWESKANRKYSVWRATNLAAGFTQVSPDLAATPPENGFDDKTATGDGPYFYRLRVGNDQ